MTPSASDAESAVVDPPTGAELSVRAFAGDLPALLQTDNGRWVAYALGKRVKVAGTQTELYKFCLNELHLTHDDFIVACIVPDSCGAVEYTPR